MKNNQRNQPEERVENLGDVELSYLYYPGDGPAIVLLHATGFSPWLWHPISRELAGRFQVVAPYFCDHRRGDPHKGGLSWPILAQDLVRLVEKLGLEAPFLAGHSMGATVCTLAAAVGGVAPKKMILIEPIYLPDAIYTMDITVEQHPLASKSIKRRNGWEDKKEAREYLRTKPLFANWDEEMMDLYLGHGMVSAPAGGLELACSPYREASQFMGAMARDPWPLLEKVSCPVLLLEGEKSGNKGHIDLSRAASLFPDAILTEVPGAGHLIPMEKPLQTLDLIRDFFSG